MQGKQGDYTREDVRDARATMEQLVRHAVETNEIGANAMELSLHVLRAIDTIGEGTEWLSSLLILRRQPLREVDPAKYTL